MYKLEKDKVLNSVLLERHSIVSVVLEKNINKNNKILDQEMEIVILKEELSLKITYYGITLAWTELLKTRTTSPKISLTGTMAICSHNVLVRHFLLCYFKSNQANFFSIYNVNDTCNMLSMDPSSDELDFKAKNLEETCF